MPGNIAFGQSLREWRRSQGWDRQETARRLHEACSESPTTTLSSLARMIGSWERGEHELSERYELAYRKLGWPGIGGNAHVAEKAALCNNTSSTVSGGRYTAEVDPALQPRNVFVKETVPVGVLLASSYLPPNPETGTTCAALTDNYRRLDALAGPSAVFAQVSAHHAMLGAWADHADRPGDWRQIAPLLADATILLAWLNFDLERHHQAQDLYRDCTEIADRLDDPDLRAFSAGRTARTLSECGRQDEALGYAEAAQKAASTSACPELRSWLAITRAYIHACLGDDYACLADIASARAALDPPASADAPPYLAFYSESYLAKWEGHALLKLGSVRRAAVADGRKAIDAALDSWAPDDVRESGEVLAACASARRVQKEIPEAARLTAQAWRVAASTSSPRIMRYVRELRRDLSPWRDVEAVRELDDLIFGAG